MPSSTSSMSVDDGSFASSTDSHCSHRGRTRRAVCLPAVARHPSRPSSPAVPWLAEAWLALNNRYERIATGRPRIGINILTFNSIQLTITVTPTLASAADFLPVFAGTATNTPCPASLGAFVGVRPKLATWPLAKQEVPRNKMWVV
ncbi:hypothetical protein SPI_00344 [Niveomyces insectorum RCEF 264]|uniref:Uncharacterized protein n=1 Tax=Niveomyces insectorum RCEF 264 TaxID=1081102 RepID=A0A168A249_9HYPO|nr:hypothetical protein SPI_00344 [Niveomyces insectorum RCEF 264]